MKDQLYLIKRGDNQFVEETDVILTASGGNIGVGSHVPSSEFDVDGKATFKAVNVNDILNVASDGKVGDIAPQEDDIIVWDGTKWKAGVNAGGIIGGSAVVTSLNQGSSTYTVNFPDTYSAVPAIATDLSIEGEGPIIPYTIANITTSGYNVIFAQPLPNNNYSIHTVFGGNVVLDTGEISGSASDWEAAGLSKIYYVGSVGIGTTDPSEALSVIGDLKVDNLAGGGVFHFGSQSDKTKIVGRDTTHSSDPSTIDFMTAPGSTDASQLRMRIDSDGNVGIGTTPDYKLHIAGGTPAMKLEGSQPRIWLSENDQSDLNSLIRNNGAIFQIDTVADNDDFIANRFSINHSSGKVGIGTTDPGAKLHVKTDTLAQEGIIVENSLGNQTAHIGHLSDGSAYFKLTDENGANHCLIRENGDNYLAALAGNVGIGTTDPGAKLEVVDAVDGDLSFVVYNDDTTAGSDAQTSSIDFKFARTGSSSIKRTGAKIVAGKEQEWDNTSASQDGYLELHTTSNTNSSPAMRIDSAGNVGIGTTSPGARLTASSIIDTTFSNTSPSVSDCVFSIVNNPASEAKDNQSSLQFNLNAGTHNHAASISLVSESSTLRRGALAFCTDNGTTRPEAMRIDSDGYVGIGTTDPGAKLDVNGNVIASSIGLNTDTGFSAAFTKTNKDPAIKFQGINSGVGLNYSLGIDAIDGNSNKFSIKRIDDADGFKQNLLTIESNGNVGIGASSPTNALNVIRSSTSGVPVAWLHNSNNTVAGNFGTVVSCINNDASINVFQVRSNNSTHTNGNGLFTVKGDGNVGIGTTSPSAALDIRRPNAATNTPAIMMGKDPRNSHGNMIIQGQSVGVHYDESGLSTVPGGASRVRFGNGDWSVDRSASTAIGVARTWETRLRILDNGNVGIGTTDPGSLKLRVEGSLYATSASAGVKSFKINHPLPEKSETHDLYHVSIEGPTADLIYRGVSKLENGVVEINIDTASRMTEGTFEALCTNVQCFTTNETSWDLTRGKVTGNILKIECQDSNCTDEISWMVIGERKDKSMLENERTDENGRLIPEWKKPEPEYEEPASEEPIAEEAQAPVSIGASISTQPLDDISDLRAEEL